MPDPACAIRKLSEMIDENDVDDLVRSYFTTLIDAYVENVILEDDHFVIDCRSFDGETGKAERTRKKISLKEKAISELISLLKSHVENGEET